MPATKVTLRDGTVLEFPHVGAVMGGANNAMITFLNEDPVVEHPETGQPIGGPKPFYAIASSEVLKIETPEYNRPPQEPVTLVIPRGRVS